MPELYVGSIAIAPVILALIQVAKTAGFPTRWVWLLNIALSALFVVVIGLVTNDPALLQPVTLAINVIIAVLTAAGMYTVPKNAAGR